MYEKLMIMIRMSKNNKSIQISVKKSHCLKAWLNIIKHLHSATLVNLILTRRCVYHSSSIRNIFIVSICVTASFSICISL